MQLATVFAACVAVAFAGGANPPSCGPGSTCPSEYPCCSADGTCGNGYVCLGGCDPRYSNKPGSCMPMPACKSGTTNFTSTDGIASYSKFLGDASQDAWSYLGNITAQDGALRAQLYKNGPGTTISSSNYVWYGKVSVTMKTSHGAGVVSDFILLSNVKDEIDYEFVGNDLTQAETNYYWHGALDYTKEVGEQVSDTNQNEHTYTIDWKPDSISWIIDGNTVRTLKKSDCYNSTSQSYSYPQTPSRVQFGLWPAGDSPSEGTSKWAGGSIDWSAPDITGSPGYLYAEISSVQVECYDPPSDAQKDGSKAYVYTDTNGMEKDVKITNDGTVLGSTDGTGENPGGSGSKNSSSSAAGAAFTLSGASASASASRKNIQLSGASTAPSSTGAAATLSGASLDSASKAAKSTDSASASGSGSSPSSSGSGSGSGSGSKGGAGGAGGKAGSSSGSDSSSGSGGNAAASGSAGSGSSSDSSSSGAGSSKNGAHFMVPSLVALIIAFIAYLI